MTEKLSQENLNLRQRGKWYYSSSYFSDSQKLGLSVAVYTDKNIPKGIILFLAKITQEME